MKTIRTLAGLSLSACCVLSCATEKAATTPVDPVVQDNTTRDKGGQKMAPMKSGIDTKNFDKAVRAQDNFFTHTNGTWLKNFEIPADKSNYGSFSLLADEAEKNLQTIIEDFAKSDAKEGDAQKIRDGFQSFMDEAAAEERGAKPLMEGYALVDSIKTKTDVARTLGLMSARSMKSPVGWWIDQDAKNTTSYILYFTQSGLGLPDRDYYLKDDDKFKKARDAYALYLEQLATMTGQKKPKDFAKKVMGLEKKLAKAQWTRVESRNRDKTYNKKTFTELQKMGKGDFVWKAFLEGLAPGAGQDVIIRQPSYFEALTQIAKGTSVDVWKAYIKAHYADRYAPLLSKEFVDAHFLFHGTTLSGAPENRPRWKRGVSHVQGMLGFALGKEYVSRHFKPEAKVRMEKLVGNLGVAFEKGIEGLEWMTPETKVQAQQKLAKFTKKIGYPNVWRDYSALEVKAGDPVGNSMRAASFEHKREMDKLGKPIDRDEWHMFPHTVNAYYNPSMNEIVFPAAILQAPFFQLDADDAVNYGAIGAVIGHEFSHGFDDQGRKSNGDGTLTDWWTEKDAKEFDARAGALVSQYDAYKPFPDAGVNGKFTLGENIGDLSGLAVAYAAYKLSLDGKEAPVIDGFTGDQRFFYGWSQIWARKYREAELRRRLLTDPHSPSEYRVLGILSNIDAFYAAFDVKEGDGMFLPAAKRVKIW